ncbi:hypothetical protein A3H89_02855 [Candidatus Amesbacteria bacterium RIFCSPLOWO2_02_FULL_48_11]|nr:MAG: hypothetical protein A3C34_04325 [Candidatus Amesbacteria bacterium RIFCSPHIGHO2_02_FULL_48_21]OGD07838.1 MAG: hypothetical protein A3H89_02855 [Candidatus Amesbacteria bacterium RIFCSPLOWO2_02_FULL_48_11]
MVEIDFYEKAFSGSPGTRTLSIEESALDMPLDSYRSILSYIQFLYVLSQFGRVLIKHGFINDLFEFPCYYRVKFYRNCVGEHWEEYVDFAGRRGLTFTKGKAAIPVVEELSHLGEKAAIEAELVSAFKNLGTDISVPEKFSKTNMNASNKEYSDLMYGYLETVDSQLRTGHNGKVPTDIVSLLFKFGFPSPICDVEKYLEEFIAYLDSVLVRNLGEGK